MLINLDDPNLPHKRFAHNHKWEPSVLEWNPSFHSSDLFATVVCIYLFNIPKISLSMILLWMNVRKCSDMSKLSAHARNE